MPISEEQLHFNITTLRSEVTKIKKANKKNARVQIAHGQEENDTSFRVYLFRPTSL